MKFRFPLYAQIISVFLLNLVLLAALQFAFFGRHNLKVASNFAWESFINDPIADRVQSIAMDMHWKLRSKSKDKWNSVLQEFGDFYGVKFAIFDSEGKQVAGEKLNLPDHVRGRIFMPRIAVGAIPTVVPFTAAVAGKSVPAPFTVATPPVAFTAATPAGALTVATPTPAFTAAAPPGSFTVAIPAVPFGEMTPGTPVVAPTTTVTESVGTIAVQGGSISSHTVAVSGAHFGPHPGVRFGPHPGPHMGPPPGGMFFFDRLMVGPPHPPPSPRFIINTKNPDRTWIGAMIPISASETSRLHRMPMPGTLVAVTPNVWQTRLISAFGNMFLAAGGVFCFTLVVWFPFVHQMTRALGKLTKATEEIADGKFDTVLQVRRWDEIGRLGLAINTMSSKLNAYVSGQKRFLGDIAHELCSPIARLQVAIELLESSSNPDQKNTIQDIREEVEQMSMLINELLAFSKASVRGRETQLRSLDLTQILEETTSKIDSQAIVLNATPGIHCQGDDILIKRALENILRNAVRYAGDHGPITVDCVRNGTYVMVSVIDCGPGVPDEAIDSLGQPFYRPEESRSRSSGGVGLGLAIVKTCIEACNGSFSVRNMQPNGLRVDIILTASEKPS